MILLDTHVLVWLDSGDARLGKKALAKIDKAFHEDALFVSAISFWETAMLVEKNRLQISIEIDQWRKNLLQNGIREISLCGNIATHSAILPDFHGDPADRMIVATALHNHATLCTADTKILEWHGRLKCITARE